MAANQKELWSVKMVETVMKRYPSLSQGKKWGVYECGVVMKGIERLYEASGDEKYLSYIKANLDEYVDDTGDIPLYDPKVYNIDHINNGKLLFFLYNKTQDERYKKAIYKLQGQLESHPRTVEGGFWHKSIYPHQMWLDGIYMGSPFYAAFAKEFGGPEHFQDVAKQVILANKHMRDMKTGLLYHGWDESRNQAWSDPVTGCSPCFWGRAMGWYAMGIVDVLEYLPEDHPQRAYILTILEHLIEAVEKVQDAESGLWYQVLDQGGREGNYLEASASCMLVYSIARAVNEGYLDSKYRKIAKKGYEGILQQLIEVGQDGLMDIKDVCEVAGLGGDPYRPGTYEYYVNESIRANDMKAVGAFILAAVELEKE